MNHCENCDQLCQKNDDKECVGNLTPEQREAYYNYLVLLYSDTTPGDIGSDPTVRLNT
jgi:hypothetical protein